MKLTLCAADASASVPCRDQRAGGRLLPAGVGAGRPLRVDPGRGRSPAGRRRTEPAAVREPVHLRAGPARRGSDYAPAVRGRECPPVRRPARGSGPQGPSAAGPGPAPPARILGRQSLPAISGGERRPPSSGGVARAARCVPASPPCVSAWPARPSGARSGPPPRRDGAGGAAPGSSCPPCSRDHCFIGERHGQDGSGPAGDAPARAVRAGRLRELLAPPSSGVPSGKNSPCSSRTGTMGEQRVPHRPGRERQCRPGVPIRSARHHEGSTRTFGTGSSGTLGVRRRGAGARPHGRRTRNRPPSARACTGTTTTSLIESPAVKELCRWLSHYLLFCICMRSVGGGASRLPAPRPSAAGRGLSRSSADTFWRPRVAPRELVSRDPASGQGRGGCGDGRSGAVAPAAADRDRQQRVVPVRRSAQSPSGPPRCLAGPEPVRRARRPCGRDVPSEAGGPALTRSRSGRTVRHHDPGRTNCRDIRCRGPLDTARRRPRTRPVRGLEGIPPANPSAPATGPKQSGRAARRRGGPAATPFNALDRLQRCAEPPFGRSSSARRARRTPGHSAGACPSFPRWTGRPGRPQRPRGRRRPRPVPGPVRSPARRPQHGHRPLTWPRNPIARTAAPGAAVRPRE